MSQVDQIGWFDTEERKDHVFLLRDYGRLKRILAELISPESQYPALCVFLGDKAKDSGLKQLYPQNNIKRHRSKAGVRLRCDVRSFDSSRPCLIVDGNPNCKNREIPPNCGFADDYSITWDASSMETVIRAAWARLIFLFSDLICIFVADFPSLAHVAEFLLECVNMGAASTLPTPVRPRIVVVFEAEAGQKMGNIDEVETLHHHLGTASPNSQQEVFSAVNIICLDARLSEPAKYEKLGAFIAGQLDDMTIVRQDHHTLFNAKHIVALFQSATKHFVEDTRLPFDFVRAVQGGYPVTPSFVAHLVHYQEAGVLAGVSYEQIAPSIASALIMDHYNPDKPGKIIRAADIY